MKKILFLTFFLCFSINFMAQKTLTREQYDALPLDVKQQIEMTSNCPSMGWGKEIGIAVNESLTAIEQSALRISDSKIGKVAMFLVIWKFCIIYVLKIIFSIIVVCFGIWGYNKFWSNHIENNGLQCDGDYFITFFYPIVIIIIIAMGLFI